MIVRVDDNSPLSDEDEKLNPEQNARNGTEAFRPEFGRNFRNGLELKPDKNDAVLSRFYERNGFYIFGLYY